jgi:hypothetical protein
VRFPMHNRRQQADVAIARRPVMSSEPRGVPSNHQDSELTRQPGRGILSAMDGAGSGAADTRVVQDL